MKDSEALEAMQKILNHRSMKYDGRERGDEFSPYIRGTSPEILEWFSAFADTILANSHLFNTKRKTIFVTVCSYAKPYSHSFIHHAILKELYQVDLLDKVERWHLSSAGMIPSVLEEEYPFCAYDWNNEDASSAEVEELKVFLADYFLRWLLLYASNTASEGGYVRRVVTYFRPESNTAQALAVAIEKFLAVIPSRLFEIVQVPILGWEDEERKERYSLGGLYRDPDLLLTRSDNLTALKLAIVEGL